MHTGNKPNLLDLDRKGLEGFFLDRGEKVFRASQVMKWIYERGVTDFADMTNLSKGLRTGLRDSASIRLPDVVADQESADGSRKWLLRLADANCIETVFIPEAGRGTLCVSSQVGCMLNCSFCSTAQQGFNRNLGVDEIIGQVWLATRELGQAPTNVVMMGMGEPLANFANVVPAMALMQEDLAYMISKSRVTMSMARSIPTWGSC